MNKILIVLTVVITLSNCQNQNSNIVTSDIKNFWTAYDKINSTQDSVLQINYLDSLYFEKGTIGLHAMRKARNYTQQDYINAINNYPAFWASVRENTLKADSYRIELEKGIKNLKHLYPDIKPAKIYFTIGALRSNGTTLDSLVLIGSELALANNETPTNEFPDNLSHLRSYFESEPSENIVFLNIHEYIHTQQKTTIGNTLLAQTVLEGVAEFVTEKALDTTSPNPQIEFGRNNDLAIKAKFELEMFSPNIYNWIWNNDNNEFGMRDLAYYVGYKISENYYNKSSNKEQAIKDMINLDYNNENELVLFVEKSGYFSKPLHTFKEIFDKNRPIVEQVSEIENKSINVKTDINVLKINFSQKMDVRFRNFQLGPLGAENVIRIVSFLGFSKDGKSVSFGIEKLEPSKQYQIVVGSGFRNTNGVPLIPYLIDFTTGEE